MFIDNKYKRTYYQLMTSRKSLNRVKSKDEYYEKHHIIPHSLGGDNSDDNLVLLTAKEHFIAHLLLTKFTKNLFKYKMLCAYTLMKGKQDITRNSKMYERLKQEYRKSMTGANNPMFGNTHSNKTKAKISAAHKNKPKSAEHIAKVSATRKKRGLSRGSNNPMFGKKGQLSPLYGIPKTEEHNLKNSLAHKGELNHQYGKVGTMTGRKHTPESILKMKGKRPNQAGVNNRHFKGYYITPKGEFATIQEAVNAHENLSYRAIRRYCQNPESKISKKSISRSSYFKSFSVSLEDLTFADLGFGFKPTISE